LLIRKAEIVMRPGLARADSKGLAVMNEGGRGAANQAEHIREDEAQSGVIGIGGECLPVFFSIRPSSGFASSPAAGGRRVESGAPTMSIPTTTNAPASTDRRHQSSLATGRKRLW
jgi:hypothetical protein